MKINEKLFYASVLVLSALFLLIGNRIATRDSYAPVIEFEIPYYTGVVTEIIDRQETVMSWDWGSDVNISITFYVRITDSGRRGEVVTAQQSLSTFFAVNEREVSVGDRVILAYDAFNSAYHFTNYVRINYIAILGAVFLALVLLFGRKKGFSAIVALGFTCMAVFMVFIPAIMSGRNIHIATIIICVYSIVSTLLIVIGPNKKALSAMLGCLGGVLLAGLLMLIMDAVLSLTGALDIETQSLLNLPVPIDIRALIFAGVIIGAVGAIMDVAMSISSSLWELKESGGISDFRGIVKSGLNIGKDILGTMLNTLILAYIGSSLSLILLVNVRTTSLMELFGWEMIIVEFLRALVGSFGMLLAIPLTAGVCGLLYAPPLEDEGASFVEEYSESLGKK